MKRRRFMRRFISGLAVLPGLGFLKVKAASEPECILMGGRFGKSEGPALESSGSDQVWVCRGDFGSVRYRSYKIKMSPEKVRKLYKEAWIVPYCSTVDDPDYPEVTDHRLLTVEEARKIYGEKKK